MSYFKFHLHNNLFFISSNWNILQFKELLLRDYHIFLAALFMKDFLPKLFFLVFIIYYFICEQAFAGYGINMNPVYMASCFKVCLISGISVLFFSLLFFRFAYALVIFIIGLISLGFGIIFIKLLSPQTPLIFSVMALILPLFMDLSVFSFLIFIHPPLSVKRGKEKIALKFGVSYGIIKVIFGAILWIALNRPAIPVFKNIGFFIFLGFLFSWLTTYFIFWIFPDKIFKGLSFFNSFVEKTGNFFAGFGKKALFAAVSITILIFILSFSKNWHDPSRLLVTKATISFLKLICAMIVPLLLIFCSVPLTIMALLPPVFVFINLLSFFISGGLPFTVWEISFLAIIITVSLCHCVCFILLCQKGVSKKSIFAGHFAAGILIMAGTFGLILPDDPILNMAAIIFLMGSLFSIIGIFTILSPLMDIFVFFRWKKRVKNPAEKALICYKNIEAYPRIFAFFKLKYDAMFKEVPYFISSLKNVKYIIDIGCGYGVPAAWISSIFPKAVICGIDPDPERIRVASVALGKKGVMKTGKAPDIPLVSKPVNLVLMIDMAHFLNDADLILTLKRLRACLDKKGLLIMRVVIPPEKGGSWVWHLENMRHKFLKIKPCYRDIEKINDFIKESGFMSVKNYDSGSDRELFWFVARL